MFENLNDVIITPRKYDRLVLMPSYRKGTFDSHAVDCPFLFSNENVYYMTYVGWDGIGYRTGLASSVDLVNWKKEGIILGRGPKGSVTEYNAAITCMLRDNEMYGAGTLKRVKGVYVGTYHSYPQPGYESGPGVIGLCFSHDLRHWETERTILQPDEGSAWEAGGLYKSWILEHEGRYYLFYNAKNRMTGSWQEQTGVAISLDLETWQRYPDNPVIRNGAKGSFDDLFASDPCVLRYGQDWVMFYYGLSSDGNARNGAALSRDLLDWEKTGKILVDVGAEGSIDSRYAHKPAIIARSGVLHHFYCAVSPAEKGDTGEIDHYEVRGITFAASDSPPCI